MLGANGDDGDVSEEKEMPMQLELTDTQHTHKHYKILSSQLKFSPYVFVTKQVLKPT